MTPTLRSFDLSSTAVFSPWDCFHSGVRTTTTATVLSLSARFLL